MFLLMCKNIKVLGIHNGEVFIYNENLRPLGLKLNTNCMGDIKKYVDNTLSFDEWCAGRLLTLNRKYAKEVMHYLNLSQTNSVTQRAEISRQFYCVSLNDSYWVKSSDSNLTWDDVSLYGNGNDNELSSISLLGKSVRGSGTLSNFSDISLGGTMAKTWVREADGYYLLKRGTNSEMQAEVLASKVLMILGIPCVRYYHSKFQEEDVVTCKCFTSENVGFSMFRSLIREYGRSEALYLIKERFLEDYSKLAVGTYLIGNVDLHDENWGVLVDMNTGQMIGLSPAFDFNYAFQQTYDLVGRSENWYPETVLRLDNHNCYFREIECTLEEAAKRYLTTSGIDRVSEVILQTLGQTNLEQEFKERILSLGLHIQKRNASTILDSIDTK